MAELTHLSTNHKAIRDQVANHPLLAFLILAFGISWIGWTLSEKIDLGLANGFGVIGSAGPAFAALIVSALLRSDPSNIPAGNRWRLFGTMAILAMAVMVVRRLWVTPQWLVIADTAYTTVAYPHFWAFLVDVLAAAAIAFLLSGIYSARQGVCDLLRSLNPSHRSIHWVWWLIALGIYPLVFLLGNTISARLGLTAPAPITAQPWLVVALDVLLTFLYLLIGGGGLEEPGWRGFVLPSLQKRYSPLRSSLILAVFWTLWHLPFFWWLGGDMQGGVLGALLVMIIYFFTDVGPSAILFTAIFNRTGGSLPIVILLHTSINTTYYMFQPVSSLVSMLWLLLGLGIILWMWRSPQTFSAHHEYQ
jgi:membrane protease YdiL (CAAX protease family)